MMMIINMKTHTLSDADGKSQIVMIKKNKIIGTSSKSLC